MAGRKRFSSKRGRPATAKTAHDKGTPELQHKKAFAETQEVIDYLYNKGYIDDEQLRLALRFRQLYGIRHGSMRLKALNLAGMSTVGIEKTAQWEAERTEEYQRYADVLTPYGLLYPLVDAVIMDDKRFCGAARKWDRGLIITALARLQKYI